MIYLHTGLKALSAQRVYINCQLDFHFTMNHLLSKLKTG